VATFVRAESGEKVATAGLQKKIYKKAKVIFLSDDIVTVSGKEA